jgi:cohesin loading factor subunit SCC2
MIEKDPQILDDKSFPALAQLVKDSSPMVRDNTVSLISKCLEQDPSLERHCLHHILNLVTDPANLPKRKAIKLLKEIYLNTTDKGKKVRIATELLLPIVDDDKTIAELTRHTFEDIWLAPLKGSSKMDENHLKLDRENRITLLIYTAQNIQNRPAHLHAFETFFTMILAPTAKNLAENFKFCREIVADMVEDVIGTGSTAAEKAQTRILQTLSIFAKVDPKLFSADQVQLLKLYVKNLATTEDLAVFHPTVVIFRYVFPALSTLQEAFLEEVRDSLSKVTGKLALQATAGHNNDKKKFQEGYNDYKRTLLDVTHCLWIISPLVKGDPPRLKSGLEKLMGVICSVATQLEPLSTLKTPNEAPGKRILSYMILLGSFGKVCDLDAHVDLFRAILTRQVDMNIANKRASAEQMKRLKAWKSPSVAVLLLDLVLPFTKQVWDISLREQALCSIGEICQQKTKHFTRADIEKAFKLPFINKDVRLIRVVLTQFRDFLETAERRSDTGAQIAVGEGAVHGQERLETSFAASDNDHATTHIARAFLADIIQTALGNDEDLALPATEILVSISRQGLLHPKECGAALVALSTSRIPDIATAASSEHRKIHLQHETMFEKEYVSAIALAFKYQRDVFDDPRGMIDGTYRPKMQLLFEAFKQGTRKTLKKFITNILGQLDFDLAKLDATRPGIPEPVLFARFCLENCALFEYAKVDEVIHVILTIESIVLKQTGPSVALSIETDIPDQEIAPETEGPANGVVINGVAEDSNKDCVTEERLRQLTSASLILQMMWETRTFLRRAFNLQGKISTKDLQRPATRMNFITGKDIWEPFTSLVTALDTSEGMKQQCRDFAEIINVDREHAVEDEDADATEQLARAAAGYETPDEKEGGGTPAPTSGRGRKRKSSTGVGGNTPKKSRGRPSGSKKIKRSSRTPDDSD